jgi:cbb3-type cytochrome oxidase cytochrome c subunit
MKNITLSADEKIIEAARARSRAEHTTLNEQFREWLAAYARERSRLQQYDAVVAELKGKVRIGRKLSRDEMNER